MSSWPLAGIADVFRHPAFVIPAALVASAIGLYLLARTWEDLREGRKKGRYDKLAEYRELYEQGLMSEAEFARICDQIAAPPPPKPPDSYDEG